MKTNVIFWVSYCLFSVGVLSFKNLYCQEKLPTGKELVNYYLVNDQLKKADSALQSQVTHFKQNSELDSLYDYPYYLGKIVLKKSNKVKATKAGENLLDFIINSKASNNAKAKTLSSFSFFYDETDQNQKSLEISIKALDYALISNKKSAEFIGKLRYNIGLSYVNLGDFKTARTYIKDLIKGYNQHPEISKKSISDAYNAMGAIHWMSSKLDSAQYAYDNAIKAISKASGDSITNLYLATVIKSNIPLVLNDKGLISEAIKTQQAVIANYQYVIDHIQDESIKTRAQRYRLRAIKNLASFYNLYGNVNKAKELLMFSLSKTKKLYEPNDSAIAKNEINIGEVEKSLKNYESALVYLKNGLQKLQASKGVNPYWEAVAYHGMAESYFLLNNRTNAKTNYDLADKKYKQALGDNYDNKYIEFLRNKSLFLAKNNYEKEAISISEKAFNYLKVNNTENEFSQIEFYENFSEIHFELQNYNDSKQWAEKGLDIITKKITSSTTSLDSVKFNFYKPKLVLLRSKSTLKLLPEADISELSQLYTDIDNALKLLEDRKEVLLESEDINLLMEDYKALTDFAIELQLRLYKKNEKPIHLRQLLEHNESAIYHRIRSRLLLKSEIAFSDIPKEIVQREAQLKEQLSKSFTGDETIGSFFKIQEQWTQFKDSLKQTFPKYYNLRYRSILKSFSSVQKECPDNTTMIRYMYINKDLYAFVITQKEIHLFYLNTNGFNTLLEQHHSQTNDYKDTYETSFELYKTLWEPLESKITTKHIIIIPDGNLFNLSFDALISKKDGEKTPHYLIEDYNLSYNFSLLLSSNGNKPRFFENNIIAFTPEFTDQMKTEYQLAITDSLFVDQSYLTLLPQPFSKTLSQKYTRVFGGTAFTNQNASKQLFTKQAKEHKIIHIGTHAESNNISPELSRLIFAKTITDSTELSQDNSLYAYEIYNQNLASNLAVLTACETGKPSYQPGEGMISLAHAFNYAGSESILTSLWKIDEQSSSTILGSFYNYLAEDLPKDEALRKAKLDYLATAQGRSKHPQYWAGMVLIGDTSAIDLSTSSNLLYWLIGLAAIILFVFIFRKYSIK